MPLWGRDCPLLALAALACVSPAGDGPVHSRLALLSPLFCEQTWRCLKLGVFGGSYPTVWFAISSKFSQFALRALRPCPYSKKCSPCLPAQPPLASGGCGRLLCFSTGSYHWARNLWVVIIYLFFLPLMLPSEVPSLATDSPVKVFPGVWKLLSVLRPPSLSLLSLFLSFIFIPTSF